MERIFDLDADGPGPGEGKLNDFRRHRTFRVVMKQVAMGDRVLGQLAERIEPAAPEEIPSPNSTAVLARTMAALPDDLEAFQEMSTELEAADVAVAFVENGPVELEELMVAPRGQSFTSFDAFKKSDIETFFGPAGDGYDYHHIVEQGPNVGTFPAASLQSTDNIVRIPRLLQAEINSYYETPLDFGNDLVGPRTYLEGQPYELQRQFGLKALQNVGILK